MSFVRRWEWVRRKAKIVKFRIVFSVRWTRILLSFTILIKIRLTQLSQAVAFYYRNCFCFFFENYSTVPILLARKNEIRKIFVFFLFIQICSLLCAHAGDENDIPFRIRFETIVSLSSLQIFINRNVFAFHFSLSNL